MKTNKIALALFLIFVTNATLLAQTSPLLDKVPSTKEEFVASEKKVISTINWLEDTPLDQDTEKRKSQYALLMGWLTNSPTVTIELDALVVSFTEKNSDLLMIFMGGWTKFCLENNYSNDKVKGNVAGIKSAIKVYKK